MIKTVATNLRRAGPPQAITAPSSGSVVREATSVGALCRNVGRDVLLGCPFAPGTSTKQREVTA